MPNGYYLSSTGLNSFKSENQVSVLIIRVRSTANYHRLKLVINQWWETLGTTRARRREHCLRRYSHRPRPSLPHLHKPSSRAVVLFGSGKARMSLPTDILRHIHFVHTTPYSIRAIRPCLAGRKIKTAKLYKGEKKGCKNRKWMKLNRSVRKLYLRVTQRVTWCLRHVRLPSLTSDVGRGGVDGIGRTPPF